MKQQPSPKKRLAIFDGLKGILILTIIFYYLFQHMLPGGFLAVNFFLLIAGFFTFRHFYVAQLKRQPARIGYFYRTRIERIFFPMLAMIVTTVSYIVAFERQFLYNIRNMAISSLIFLNNYYQIFSNQSYFVQSVNPSPFTHLWYIALYTQLIVLTPLVMLLLHSWHKKAVVTANMLLVLSLLSAITLGYLYRPNADPSRIYYDILTRAFAFTLGGAIGLLFPAQLQPKPLSPQLKRTFNLTGLITIALSFLMLKFVYGTQPFAYRFGMALYTLISAVLMIAVLHPQTIWHKLFSNPVFVFFGKRSLSYYLWFYPIHLLAPQKLTFISENVWLSSAVQFALIMLFSEISYRLFEQRQILLPFGQDFNFAKSVHKVRYLMTHKGTLLGIKALTIIYGIFLVTGTIGAMIAPESRNNVAQDVQKVIEENQKIAESTRTESTQEVKIINNIEGLTREELLHANALEVTFIGDSILAASVEKLRDVFPKAVFDEAIGRHLYQSVPVVDNLKAQEKLYPTVVTILGTNSSFTEGQLNDYIEAVGTDRQHYFITSAAKKEWVYNANAQIHLAAQRYENVKVIDWATYANDYQYVWFYEDGIHPNQDGALELAKYVAQQIYLQR
ncbi:MAG: acyltransferase family protein [Aerococcaceae bacterium]|nr:acyltransferase family protein [Aerococcaceae bacterium]